MINTLAPSLSNCGEIRWRTSENENLSGGAKSKKFGGGKPAGDRRVFDHLLNKRGVGFMNATYGA